MCLNNASETQLAFAGIMQKTVSEQLKQSCVFTSANASFKSANSCLFLDCQCCPKLDLDEFEMYCARLSKTLEHLAAPRQEQAVASQATL